MPEREVIGFDRDIRLGWLDATADLAAQRLGPADIRKKLDGVLAGEVPGEKFNSARGKTKTVLLHIWVLVPPRLKPLRDAGLALFERQDQAGRLALHWGMALATYPFFRDLASTIGRLIDLQANVTTRQVARRMAETWGDRSTVARAVPRAFKSLVDWGVLRPGEDRNVFAPAPRIDLSDRRELGIWLVETCVASSSVELASFRRLVTSSVLFPFSLSASAVDLTNHPRMDVFRQGGGEEMVMLRART